MNYYHITSLCLNEGDIISPGNWGQSIKARQFDPMAQNANSGWYLSRELIFELVRIEVDLKLPSRWSCIFVFDALEVAKQNKKELGATIYEVEFVDAQAPLHRAGWNLVRFPHPGDAFFHKVRQNAEKYWRGNDIQIPEVLAESALRVKSIIS